MRKYKRKLIISLSMLIFPWLTAPFIGTKSFVRFLPVATFANLFIIVFTLILYGYQYIVEKVIGQTNDSQSRLQALKANIQKRPSNS
ncbi:hypothetical protein ACW5UC_17830 [Priestia aryabhattai]|uniref:hypothetical protein n=1 Tax=Priestia megaterium TaxID=1404 RepID=UPI003F9C1B48